MVNVPPNSGKETLKDCDMICLEQVFTNASYPHHKLFSVFRTLSILVCNTVLNSKPHQEIIPPNLSLWFNFHKHLCSPHWWRFQWCRWLWQCNLHRHLSWICKQSQLVVNGSDQLFNNIWHIILSTWSLRSNAPHLPSFSIFCHHLFRRLSIPGSTAQGGGGSFNIGNL